MVKLLAPISTHTFQVGCRVPSRSAPPVNSTPAPTTAGDANWRQRRRRRRARPRTESPRRTGAALAVSGRSMRTPSTIAPRRRNTTRPRLPPRILPPIGNRPQAPSSRCMYVHLCCLASPLASDVEVAARRWNGVRRPWWKQSWEVQNQRTRNPQFASGETTYEGRIDASWPDESSSRWVLAGNEHPEVHDR